MKKELSQMAFDFPMEAEPQAPPKNGLSTHPGEHDNKLTLSEEEEHTVREEGRRAGVVVRIKSLKRPPEQALTEAEPPLDPVLAPAPQPIRAKAPEPVFIQTSIPLEDIDLPVVKAEIPATGEETPELALVEEAPVHSSPIKESAAPEIIQAVAEPPASVEDESLKDEVIPEVLQVPSKSSEEDRIPQSEEPSAEVTPEEPPFPPRKKSTTRPATAKAKPAPAEKTKSKRGRKSLKEVGAEADLIDIPADEVLFSKQYYTMGEVAEMFRVNQSLLRFWETEFSILQPRKNRKGDRYFRPIDIKNLHLIYHLLRQRKYTIEGAKEFLRKNKKAEQRFEAIQRLQQIKAFLLELKAQL